ncbi:glycoside hydrolase family 76 protein [Gordonia sp. AC31]|uniref:glycoside hydrolase family 76 protein n=1 Tax=Gordonia sp. AC31 TaxID=2962571 RepID=UPI0028829BC6|nr:glycoside hydrolase family 76 protein [Gordonia sp. AC31]MDT0223182.1 glycoside hydrolase family 76 protein [Gordonia sp. AC31]
MDEQSKSSDLRDPNARAQAAADAIYDRHLQRAFWLPGTRAGAVAWPIGRVQAQFGSWHYWWQAHLVDLLVDAAIHRVGSDRSFDPDVADDANRLMRGIRVRNGGRWTNNYYDDMAWLGLAIERADRHLHLDHASGLRVLAAQMLDAWVPADGGGIPWRKADQFFNAPANGPAAILLARTGHVERAVAMCDWMDANLVDPDTHLVIDGLKKLPDGSLKPETGTYTYCQGVVLGAELEALRVTGDHRHLDRLTRLLGAVERHSCTDGVINGGGGGDGGLFHGVLARYLALIATDLPEVDGSDELRTRAARIVTRSADAAWAHRTEVAGRVIFSSDWRRSAVIPTDAGTKAQFVAGAVNPSEVPERDLSVQLSAWMVLEAAAAVDLGLPECDQEHTRP